VTNVLIPALTWTEETGIIHLFPHSEIPLNAMNSFCLQKELLTPVRLLWARLWFMVSYH